MSTAVGQRAERNYRATGRNRRAGARAEREPERVRAVNKNRCTNTIAISWELGARVNRTQIEIPFGLQIHWQCALLTHPPDTKINFAVRQTIATGKLDLPPKKQQNRKNQNNTHIYNRVKWKTKPIAAATKNFQNPSRSEIGKVVQSVKNTLLAANVVKRIREIQTHWESESLAKCNFQKQTASKTYL